MIHFKIKCQTNWRRLTKERNLTFLFFFFSLSFFIFLSELSQEQRGGTRWPARRQRENEYQLHGYLALEFSGNSRSKSSPGTPKLRWTIPSRPRELSHLHMNWRSPCRSTTLGPVAFSTSGRRRWTHTTRWLSGLAVG